jgi:hypothetical protein
LESRWYGDNAVVLFRSIPTRLDDHTQFTLVFVSHTQQLWVIPIESGMLEYPHIESDPHNLAAFNRIISSDRTPQSEMEWESLSMSYLAVIGHDSQPSKVKVSCEKEQCFIEISDRLSAKAEWNWRLIFNSHGRAPRLEDVHREVKNTDD